MLACWIAHSDQQTQLANLKITIFVEVQYNIWVGVVL